jgi:hypothetical protein
MSVVATWQGQVQHQRAPCTMLPIREHQAPTPHIPIRSPAHINLHDGLQDVSVPRFGALLRVSGQGGADNGGSNRHATHDVVMPAGSGWVDGWVTEAKGLRRVRCSRTQEEGVA